MQISELIAILQNIQGTYGDLHINIHYDPRQSESIVKDSNGINIDDLKTVQISEDSSSIYLMNKYSWMDMYNGCTGEAFYNADTKLYEGRVIPSEYIEGFDLTFVSDDKYKIPDIFKDTVDKYNEFLGNVKITQTLEAINNIMNEESTDYQDEYESSDDDEDYGEV